MSNLLKSIAKFYIDGIKEMKLGKKLWLIVIIKLFIIFGVIKLLFFPNILEENFSNDKARSEYIIKELIGD